MKRMHYEQTDTVEATTYKPHPMASSQWAEVWRLPILLFSIVVIAGIPLLFYAIATHWSIAAQWLEILLTIILSVLGIRVYFAIRHKYHAHTHKERMDRLEYEARQAEIRLEQAKLKLLDTAMAQRANVKMHDSGAVEVVYVPAQVPARVTVTEEKTEPRLLLPPSPELPGPCDLTELLLNWRPSQQEILLAIGPGKERLTVPMKSLCHVALAGATGGGKSTVMRLLLSQLLYIGVQVVLVDPHYAPIDMESGEDWRSIASRLMMEPVVRYQGIEDTLKWLACSELPARLEKRRQALPVGKAIFLAMDELPAIVKNVPDAPDYMGDLLREGRKVGLYLVSAAQDWLVKTIGGSGGVRDCFRTAFYVGGDATTARVLLDIKGRVDDGGLGKGIVMLRSFATPQASLSRVPYASNEALEMLLDIPEMPTAYTTANPLQTRFVQMEEIPQNEAEEVRLDARSQRVRDMLRSGQSQRQIIQELYGVSGGAKYMEAAKEIASIIAKLV